MDDERIEVDLRSGTPTNPPLIHGGDVPDVLELQEEVERLSHRQLTLYDSWGHELFTMAIWQGQGRWMSGGPTINGVARVEVTDPPTSD